MVNKKKKAVMVLTCMLLVLTLFLIVRNDEKRELGNAVWNLSDYMDSKAVSIVGKEESEDYPYGYNVGTIEDDEIGTGILITPGTAIEIDGIVTENMFLDASAVIHPWVAKESDGALLSISITAGKESKNYVYDIDEKTQNLKLALNEFSGGDVRIKIELSNEEGKNENCDWVVLKKFIITGGEFKPKQAKLSETGYVKSATYFADEWPLNFWNSEMDHLDFDLRQIKEDGFDSIILVIPWREFQTGTEPVTYNDYAFQKLDEVMKSAIKSELGVYVRIGYTWDYVNDNEENIVDQFCRLMGDQILQEAWFDYVGKMYKTLSSYENFKKGFLTWEDFWNNLGVCDEVNEKARIEKALFTGYQAWVKDNYMLEVYNKEFGTSYETYEQIPVPQRNEPAMEAMYAFYDFFLNSLLEKSQEKFPDLSMEVRMDWDVIYKLDGTTDYYKHNDTFSCENSSFSTTMYGIPMGFENIGERVSYREAMKKTEYILQQFKLQNGNKPVYIDQFIFADNTPKFKNNAQIKEEELNLYLNNISSVLLENSDGYGIWTYRNYCTNMLYNSQFALEDTGWEKSEGVIFEEIEKSNACSLMDHEKLRQVVPDIRNHFESDEYIFEFDIVDLEQPGIVSVTVGNERREVEIETTGKVSLTFPLNDCFDVSIESQNCRLSIDNLRLYSQIQQGYLYDENNKELQCLDGIRMLNSTLK